MHIGSGMLSAETVAKKSNEGKNFLKPPSAKKPSLKDSRNSCIWEIRYSNKNCSVLFTKTRRPNSRVFYYWESMSPFINLTVSCCLWLDEVVWLTLDFQEQKKSVFLKIPDQPSDVGILHDILSVFVQHNNANVSTSVFRDRSTTCDSSLWKFKFSRHFPDYECDWKIPSITCSSSRKPHRRKVILIFFLAFLPPFPAESRVVEQGFWFFWLLLCLKGRNLKLIFLPSPLLLRTKGIFLFQ